MILFGSSLSPYVRKVLAFAGEKGVDLELRPTGSAPGQPSSEFLEASPLRKMPALRNGSFKVADSSAIVHYLDALRDEPRLIPCEPEPRAKVIWFEEFADTSLISCCAKMFYNRVVLPRFYGKEGDAEAARTAELQELPPLLDYLEGTVPDPGEYLVGVQISLADVAVASPFATFEQLACNRDMSRHSRTYAYVDSILARPSFRLWLERDRALMSKVA